LPGTNTLAYSKITDIKSFITLGPGGEGQADAQAEVAFRQRHYLK
jgi:hypothetical protein